MLPIQRHLLDADYIMPVRQQIALTIVPAISATLSIVGSSVIIIMLVKDWKRKVVSSIKYRLLLALFVNNVINSLWYVFWSLPIPEGTPNVWGARGNKQTCDAQGVFFHLGVSGSLYNGALSGYFLYKIRYRMSEKEISQSFERRAHIVAIVWPIATALGAYGFDLYSFSAIGCYIAPYPHFCKTKDDLECSRGDYAYAYAWFSSGVPLLLVCAYISYTMACIYKTVRDLEREVTIPSTRRSKRPRSSDSFSMDSDKGNDDDDDDDITTDERRETALDYSSNVVSYGVTSTAADARVSTCSARVRSVQTKDTAIQAALYVAAYVFTHMWAFIVLCAEQAGIQSPFALRIMQNFFWPSQGFFNVIVFLRPRVRAIRYRMPELTYWQALYRATFKYEESRMNQKPEDNHLRSVHVSSTAKGRSVVAYGQGCSMEMILSNVSSAMTNISAFQSSGVDK